MTDAKPSPAPLGPAALTLSDVSAVSVKLGPFWTHDPEAWFNNADAQFCTRGISESLTKYYHVLAALTPEVVQTVKAQTRTPPAGQPYETLRKALVDRHTPPVLSSLIALIEAPRFSPDSDLMTFVDRLDGLPITVEDFKRALVISKFPEPLQSTVLEECVAGSHPDLRSMGKGTRLRLKACPQPSLSVAALRQPSSGLNSKGERRLCLYHRQYGTKAKKCRSPCDWKPKTVKAIQYEEFSGNDDASC